MTGLSVVGMTRQGLPLRNPASGWPFALSAFACALVASIATLERWRSGTDSRSLLLLLLLAGATAAGGRVAFVAADAALLSPPLIVYVVTAAVLAGPLAAITVGTVAGASVLISPRQAQLFNGSLGALQGAVAAATAVQFGPLGLSRSVPVACAAVAAAAALTWSVGQVLVYIVRSIPMRRLWEIELPATGGDFVVALGVAPAIVFLYRDAGILPTAVLAGVMFGTFALFRSYRKHLIDLNAQIKVLSRTDPLTGAANRRAFTERLEQERNRSSRTSRPFALLLLDLDNFKQLNDLHGHVAADHVLTDLTARLRSQLRGEDMLARLGGDEFAVIATEAADGSAVETLAAEINQTARGPFHYAEAPIRLSASIGAILAYGHLEPEQILSQADAALYDAKRGGRDRLTLSTSPPPR